MSTRRTYFALLIVASVALLAPFFVIDVLPLQDYPNHLARIHILSHLENSPILQQYYQASWTLVPNLAMDVIVPLLAQLFPLEVAGAIFCALVLLSTAPAVSLLHYTLHRKLSLWPFVCVLFTYNYVFIMGWLNYLLGQCCPGKVAPSDGKSRPFNVLWPVLPGNDLKSRGRKWSPERSIRTRHNEG